MLNQIRTILSVIIITALLLGSGLPFGEQPAAAADGEGQDLPPIELPKKGNPKLDSQLNQLVSAETPEKAASFAEETNIDLVDGNVRVIVECLPDQVDAASRAASELGTIETSYRNLLQVIVPITQLEALAANPSISLVRLPQYPLLATVSEGVALINADEWQTAGYTGAGVKVAILDVGFTGYSSLLGTELPASVTTQSFLSGSDIEGSSDHGTACAEVIYDIAPDAQFYLVNFGTDVELGNAMDWLVAQGVDVISASLGHPLWGPGDGTGYVCEMFDTAYAAGILSSVAMHNYAQTHWQGDFVDINADGWHEFAPGDATNTITASSGQTIAVWFKWDDTWGASANDYDLYLFDSSLTTPVAGSTRYQDGDDDPIEGFSYTATYTGYYHIAINGYYATTTANFHLYTYWQTMEYITTSSSFTIPADSPNVMSVGAVYWNTPTVLESFSSRGPTQDNRIKPDLVGPDGGSSVTYGNFYGTSASTPHAAGAAVLVKERYPSYTPAQIQDFLEGRAVELGAAGKDNLYGSGRLYLGSPPGLTPPTVSTTTATSVTSTSATLNGTLDDLGTASTVDVSFEYGLTTAYGNETTPQVMTTIGPFSFNLSSLSPNTTYHFRGKAVGGGTSYGSDKSFTTLTAPNGVTATATRTIATPSLAPGATTEITVTFTSLLTETKSFALDEDIPSGWTFTRGTDDASTFKESTHEWVWYSVYPGATKTATYTLTAPASAAPGVYSISGTVTAAGVANTVGGDTSITVRVGPTATATRTIATPSLARGGTTEITVTFTSLLTETKSFALKENIPSGWTFTRGTDDAATFKESTHEWVWFSISAGASKTVTYSLTAPADAEGVYSISGTVTASGVANTVGGDSTIAVSLDILAYYRAYSGDPNVVDTEDLLKAADDWANGVIPPGFTEPLTTAQLLQLADEWAAG